MDSNFWFAFLLTLFAGLSTGLGSVIGLIVKKESSNFLAITLGFSAGVMLYVSFVEIFFKANDMLLSIYGNEKALWITVISFFGGMGLIILIDKFLPNFNECSLECDDSHKDKGKLLRMGLFTALAVGIHNFPEGLATFMSALSDPSLGIAIAIAIAIHNIPEGLAVSVPIYYATGSKFKAFKYSFLSGIAEPIGAIVGYIILRNFLNDAVMGIIFAIVAGIMVFISLEELLPAAKKYEKYNVSIYGLVMGMVVMAISLLLL